MKAGHGESRCGFFWLKDQEVSTEYEEVSLDTFLGILKAWKRWQRKRKERTRDGK
jgi:hypothetical protein